MGVIVMGGKGSGRKTKVVELQATKQILSGLTYHCAVYLRDCMTKKKFRPSWAKLKVCEYVLDRELGKAKIMAEVTGEGGAPLTWQALVLLAGQADQVEGEAKSQKILELVSKPPKALQSAKNSEKLG